jgi:hypothetical protein
LKISWGYNQISSCWLHQTEISINFSILNKESLEVMITRMNFRSKNLKNLLNRYKKITTTKLLLKELNILIPNTFLIYISTKSKIFVMYQPLIWQFSVWNNEHSQSLLLMSLLKFHLFKLQSAFINLAKSLTQS